MSAITWLGAISTEPELLAVPGLSKTTPEFRWKLWETGQRLQINASYIAAVMSLESGFDPAIRNAIGATGLIQFMPKTALKLGTTVEALASMSAVEQLVYVEKFYSRYRGQLKTPGQVYLATFKPEYTFSAPDTEIARSGSKTYDQNKGLDVNGDGVITVSDVTRKIEAVVSAASGRPATAVSPSFGTRVSGGARAVAFGAAAFLAIWLMRRR